MISGFLRRPYSWIGASLYRKYVLTISLLVVVALLISGGLDVFFTYKDKLNSISDLEREEAFLAASSIDFFIGDVQRQLEQAALVQYEDDESGTTARRDDYMALVSRVVAVTELGYWNPSGQEPVVISQVGPDTFTTNSPLSVEQILDAVETNGRFNGPVYLGEDSFQHMTIAIAEPGAGKGVLIAGVNLNIVQVIISRLSLHYSHPAYVVDSNGVVLAHSAEENVTQHTNVVHLPQVESAIGGSADPDTKALKETVVSIEKNLEGETVFATSLPIGNLGWHVLVEHPRTDVLASVRAPILRSVLLLMVGLIFAVLTSLILARKMVSPILNLRNAADELGHRSTDHVIGLETGDELDSLGRSFVRMSDQIKESYATLEDRVDQRTEELLRSNADLEAAMKARKEAESTAFLLQRAMEHSSTVILITDAKGVVEYVNPKFTEVTGYTAEETLGKPPSIRQSGRTSRKKYDRLWETIQAGGEWEGELYNKRKDGEFYWSYEKIVPIKDSQGVTTHYLSLEQDVTEKKTAEEAVKTANRRLEEMNRTLEQRVNERTSDLEQANNRLIEAHDQLVRTEKLATIGELSAGVAHDLRNPLGTIKNAIYYLNGKILNTEPARENPRISEFLKIIDDEVDNSSKIITDLMDFARVSTPTFSPVDLGTLVQDCLSKLNLNEGIYINIQESHDEESMQVQADGRQLHRVFQNLIQNAQDAMPDGGVITVSTKDNNGFAEVAVSDTGQGIDPDHVDKIFDPLFTTKTKGTGLGLAVCQQIVARHGGMIDVKSRLGVGAVFRVRLPVIIQDDLASEATEREALNAT